MGTSGLRLGAERLRTAKGDPDLVAVADWLWAMALQIEDGDLSEAERELRAAQDRLREAMDCNAPNEEIKRLTDELRQAMDKFLREFAERMQRQQNQQAENQQRQALTGRYRRTISTGCPADGRSHAPRRHGGSAETSTSCATSWKTRRPPGRTAA